MRYARIENGVVVQVLVDSMGDDFIETSEEVGVGYTYVDGVFIPPVQAALDLSNHPLPRWKFHAMLEILGKKAQVEAAIAAMPLPEGAIARAKYYQASSFSRNDPLVLQLIPVVQMSEGEIDAAWRTAIELV